MIELKGRNQFGSKGNLDVESKFYLPLRLEFVESLSRVSRDTGGSLGLLLLCSMVMSGRLKTFGT